MRPELRSVSFRCRGHPDIRASHHKSVEFTRQAGITGRATCVLGVSADAGLQELTDLRGPVTITVEVGTSRDVIHAVANPEFEPGESAVIRTSRHSSPETLAVAADKGADRLDRALIAELADSTIAMRVTVAERPASGRPGGGEMVFVAPQELRSVSSTREIREVLDRADAVFAADPPAARTVLDTEGIEVPVRIRESDDEIRARLHAAERLAYVATTGARAPAHEEGPEAGKLMRAASAAADGRAATRILPAPSLEFAAQVAAAPEAAPYTLIAPPFLNRRGRAAALEGAAAAGANLVWRAAPQSVPDALADVADVAGQGPVRLSVSVASRQGFLLRGCAADVARQWDELGRPPGDTVVVAAGQGLRGVGAGRLDAALTALLDEDVSTRTLARALGSLPGHDYRSEYRRMLRLKSSRGRGAG